MDDAKKEGEKESEEKGKEAKKEMREKILKELDDAFKKAAEMKTKAGPTFGENIKEEKLPTPIVTKEEYDKARKEDGHDHDDDHDHDHDKKEGGDKDE